MYDARPTNRPPRTRRWLGAASALVMSAALSAVVANCSEEQSATSDPACGGVSRAECGASCTYDSDCAAGLYCTTERTCDADCAEGGVKCPAGQVCTERGRCSSSGNGAGGDESTGAFGNGVGTGAGTGGGSAGCGNVNITFSKQTPTVVLLIDQSGSMRELFDGPTDRWEALYDTLMDANTGVVKLLENEVRFGLALYTSRNGNSGGTCPLLTDVDIALGNFAAIDRVYRSAVPIDDTPTGESITAVTAQLAAFDEVGPKVVVLATDGLPDTCEIPDTGNAELMRAAQRQSVEAAQAAFTGGIRTFVISVGDDVGEAHLQDVANAGAGLPIDGAENARFYLALDQQTLVDAFNEIIGGVRSCAITIDGTLDVVDAALGTVTLDGQLLPYNDPNGWKFNPPDVIELVGTACETIKDGDHDLAVTFPCDTVVPR